MHILFNPYQKEQLLGNKVANNFKNLNSVTCDFTVNVQTTIRKLKAYIRSIKRRGSCKWTNGILTIPMFIFSISFNSIRFENIWYKQIFTTFSIVNKELHNTKICPIFLRILNCQLVIAFVWKLAFSVKVVHTGIFNLFWFLSNYSWQYKTKKIKPKKCFITFLFSKSSFFFPTAKGKEAFCVETNGRNSQIFFKSYIYVFFAF